jgi:hypothetical protein
LLSIVAQGFSGLGQFNRALRGMLCSVLAGLDDGDAGDGAGGPRRQGIGRVQPIAIGVQSSTPLGL